MKNRIKEIRKQCGEYGKTQEAFAEYLGIPKSNLTSYEIGRRTPSESVIRLICEKCNINEKWLRDGIGEMKKPVDDEVAAIVSDLLEVDSPFYTLILDIVRTFNTLDGKSQEVLNNFAKELFENMKKEG